MSGTAGETKGRDLLRVRGHLVWRQWAQESVVYDDVSGRTHLLDDTTAGVLLLIQDGAMDVQALASRMAFETGCTIPEALVHLPAIIVQLQRADLIDASPR